MKYLLAQTDILSLRFIKFCCVGAANTLVDFLTYSTGLWLGLSPYLARVMSSAAGCLFSFLVNRTWTFKATDKGVMQLARFAVVNFFTLCLSVFLLFAFKKTGFGNTAAYLLSLPFTLAANYLGYRLWTFREIH